MFFSKPSSSRAVAPLAQAGELGAFEALVFLRQNDDRRGGAREDSFQAGEGHSPEGDMRGPLVVWVFTLLGPARVLDGALWFAGSINQLRNLHSP